MTSRYCIQLWVPQYGNVLDQLEEVQQRSPRWSGEPEHLPCEDRVRKWGLFCREKRWCRGEASGADLRPASQHLQGGYQDDGARLSTRVHGGRAEDNKHKLQKERFKLVIRKDTFMVRTVRQWSRCPGRLCSLRPWRLSRPDQTKSTVTWSPQFGLKITRGPFHPELLYGLK